jgi:CheY-like chemotaxis protein
MTEKILIIDDDIDTLKLVGLMLERQGYDIVVASNGTLGLSKAVTEQPDLILLDVMMPDLDGYEVTRRLRSDPAISNIPIIMFTAKTMVDDKVTGFEAGVDDYLTKPTHPAELSAHVRAVLTRRAQTHTLDEEKANIIGFLGARGGIGTSTIALNCSIALQHQGNDVLLAEMNPGRGTIGLELKDENPNGLSNLLTRSLKDIHLRSVETEIANHRTGLRLLFSSPHPAEAELDGAVAQFEAIVNNLSAMSSHLILDLGSHIRPYTIALAKKCSYIMLVVEPIFPTNVLAEALVEELVSRGLSRRRMGLGLITRERTSLSIPWRQLAADLDLNLAGIISPAPEQAHQASQNGKPLIILHPASLVSDQIHKLSEHISSVLDPALG